MEEIKLGSVVELQSGSSNNLMTVIAIDTDSITVRYEDKENWNKLKTETLPSAALKVYVAPVLVTREEDDDNI